MQEAQAKAKVEKAMLAGHLTPAMVPWATALCNQDPASFDEFMRKSPAPFAHLFKYEARHTSALSTSGDTHEASEELSSICSQLGLDPSRLKP